MTPFEKAIQKAVDTTLAQHFLNAGPQAGMQSFIRRTLPSGRSPQAIQDTNDRVRSSITTLTPTQSLQESNNPSTPYVPQSTLATTLNPFNCVIAKTTGGSWVKGLFYGSKLTQTYDPTDTLTISNILGSLNPDPNSDPGFSSLSTTDKAWLEINISSTAARPYTVSSVHFKSTGAGDTLFTSSFVNDGGTGTPIVYAQTQANLMLTEFMDDGHGNPVVQYQWVNSALRFDYGDFGSFDSSGGSAQQIFALYPYGV